MWESVTPYVPPRHHLRGGKEREGESIASAESAIKAATTELRREELVSTPEDVAASEPTRTVSDVQAATTVVESPEIAAADSLVAKEFQEQKLEAKRVADQLEASKRMQVTVVSESDLRVSKAPKASGKR